jgi:hypothetical protein
MEVRDLPPAFTHFAITFTVPQSIISAARPCL